MRLEPLVLLVPRVTQQREKPQAKGIRAIAAATADVAEEPVGLAAEQPTADVTPAPVAQTEQEVKPGGREAGGEGRLSD